jgi:hypothetical protein
MMMSSIYVSRALPPGVSDVGAKRWLIEKGGDRGKSDSALLLLAYLAMLVPGERNDDRRIGEQ